MLNSPRAPDPASIRSLAKKFFSLQGQVGYRFGRHVDTRCLFPQYPKRVSLSRTSFLPDPDSLQCNSTCAYDHKRGTQQATGTPQDLETAEDDEEIWALIFIYQ